MESFMVAPVGDSEGTRRDAELLFAPHRPQHTSPHRPRQRPANSNAVLANRSWKPLTLLLPSHYSARGAPRALPFHAAAQATTSAKNRRPGDFFCHRVSEND